MVSLVDPAIVVNDVDSPILITGTDFAVLSGTQVITPPTVLLDNMALPEVGWVTSATLTSTVPAGFPAGVYTVTVKNPDSLSGSLPSGLTVQNPIPQLQGFGPDSGFYGQSIVLTITGADFVPTPTVSLDETACPAVRYVSSKTLTTTIPGNLLPGVYDLTVRNPGPGDPQDVIDNAFTLYSPTPTVTAIAPQSAFNDVDTHVIITGAGFAPTPTVTLGATLLEDVTWISSTQVTALIPWGMDSGRYGLTVTNPEPGASSAVLSDVFTVTQGFNVWTTGGPYGGHIQELVLNPVTPTTVYAVVANIGVFASYDAAATWQMILRNDWLTRISFDAGDSEVTYIGGDGSLLRTMDGGGTWQEITPPAVWTQSWKLYRPIAHPTLPGVIYTGKRVPREPDEEGGLYWSDDYGTTWETRTTGLTDTHVIDIVFHPDDPNTMVVGTQSGNVFLSNDGGQTWNWRARVGPRIERLDINPFGTHEVWASTSPTWDPVPPPYLYKSSPDLTAWAPITVTDYPGGNYPVQALTFLSNTIWAAAGYGYTSTDGGANWSPVGWVGISPEDGVTAFAIDPGDPNMIYAGHSLGGVFKSSDGSISWSETNKGLAGVVSHALVVSPADPDTIYAYTWERGLLTSDNGGRSWYSLDVWRGGVPSPRMLAVDPFTPTRVYLGDTECEGAFCIRISEDAGNTWRQVTTTLSITLSGLSTNMNVVAPHPTISGRILAGVTFYPPYPVSGNEWLTAGVYASDDYGEHWEVLWPSPTLPFSQVLDLAYDAVDPNLIYAGTGGAGLWKSADGGVNWQAISIPGVLPPVGIESVAVHPDVPNTVFARVLSFATTSNPGGDLFISGDAGVTWTQLQEDTSDAGLLFVPPQPDNPPYMLYTACGWGLCRSINEGQSWQQVYGVPRPSSMAAGSDGERIVVYVATPGGMASAEGKVANVFGRAEASDELSGLGSMMGGGVYRTTMRMLNQHVYLPLVLRKHTP
jgi:photosystem II stability/assembly factor-like uncharacterized protein